MKFTADSKVLMGHLNHAIKFVPRKGIDILDNFLFRVSGEELTIMASDSDASIVTSCDLVSSEGEVSIAIAAHRLVEFLKTVPEQPIKFEIDDSFQVKINSATGEYTLKGIDGADYPKIPEVETADSLTMPAYILHRGIEKTVFAASDDPVRSPTLAGIFVEVFSQKVSFTATNTHKLSHYSHKGVHGESEFSFILPKRTASLLPSIISTVQESPVGLAVNERYVAFRTGSHLITCRRVQGEYPNYPTIIPQELPNVATMDRISFYHAINRVEKFSSKASNMVKISLEGDSAVLAAQDADFSLSGKENISMAYQGEPLDLNFSAVFLSEALALMDSSEITLEVSEATRPGLLSPVDKEDKEEEMLIVLMPIIAR